MEQINIYKYFAAFLSAAKKAGWSQEQINLVLEDARSGDYDHAAATLLGAIDEAEDSQKAIISY